VNTGKECHLDAHYLHHALEELPLDELDIVFVENVGNLVCPADFPLGTDMRVVVVSVTEGDDMVRKHPVIFGISDVAVVNKIDIAEHVGVDPKVIVEDFRRVKPGGKIVLTSARTGEGIEELMRLMGL
jgi:hydrogenase nickel incorporation protein HypB